MAGQPPALQIGMTVAQLTLLEILPDRYRSGRVGLWVCTCGERKKIPLTRVRSGGAQSCGCRRRKHGYSSRRTTASSEYKAWLAMRARCAAQNTGDFYLYAARGVTVCPRWDSFPNFLQDMGPRPTPRHSVGRIDNNKGYEPANCRWETPAQQMQNTRASKIWNIKGRTFASCREAAAYFGVNHRTIRYWAKTGKEGSYAHSKY